MLKTRTTSDTAGMIAMYEAAKVRAAELGIVVIDERVETNWATGTKNIRFRAGLYGPSAACGAYDKALLKNLSDFSGGIDFFVEKVAEASKLVVNHEYALDLIAAGAFDVYGAADEKRLRDMASALTA